MNLWGDVVCWPTARCMSQADEVLPDCCQVKLRCDSNLLTLVSITPYTIKSKAIEYKIVQAKLYLRASCHFHPNTRILHWRRSKADAACTFSNFHGYQVSNIIFHCVTVLLCHSYLWRPVVCLISLPLMWSLTGPLLVHVGQSGFSSWRLIWLRSTSPTVTG